MPRDAAESLPKVNASSARRCHRHTTKPSTATGTASHTDGQRTPLRLPSSQNMMPRACSELADLVIRNAVSALNNCEPAMPARMICPVPLAEPLARASRITSANAAMAPTNAPADSEISPAANAHQRHQHRAGRSAGGDAQQIRIGQRVAQQRLQNHPAGRQPGTARGGDQGAGQAVVPHDAFIDRVEHVAGVPQFVGQHLQHHLRLDDGFADGHAGEHCDQQQVARASSVRISAGIHCDRS